MSMIFSGYRIPATLKAQAKAKAHPIPLAKVIRALIWLFVNDRVQIDWDEVPIK